MDKELSEMIEHAKDHLCDLIPHDSPTYDIELQILAERYVDFMQGEDDCMFGGSIDTVCLDDDLPW